MKESNNTHNYWFSIKLTHQRHLHKNKI